MNETENNEYRVSIALATFNGAKYLPALLESLNQQTLRPLEIIAFDDGSSDETCAILSKYSKHLPLTIYVNERPKGVVQNFKSAVGNCHGKYIALCDQDDVWLPDKLAQSVQALQLIDGPWPAMVYTNLIIVDENLDLIAESYWQHRKLRPDKETFASLIYGNVVTGCTMLINRQMTTEVARMPDDVLMHDFWIACVAYGVGRCAFIEQPTMLYRQHTTNVTSNEAVTWQTRWKRLSTFLFKSEQAAHFLRPEIDQAIKYSRLYANRLTTDNQAALARLLKLQHQLPVLRKWRTFLIKFLHLYVYCIVVTKIIMYNYSVFHKPNKTTQQEPFFLSHT